MALQNAVYFWAMDHPLGRWRAKQQVSQEELGRRCGLSQKTISAYESGTRVPRGDSLRRLQAETSLPLEALIFPEVFLRKHPDFLVEQPTKQPRSKSPRKRIADENQA